MGKKIKTIRQQFQRKIGIKSLKGRHGSSDLFPALAFHEVHGENVRLSNGGRTATRVESFCKGVAFSQRPVKVGEKIYIKFTEVSTAWSGVLRFGITKNNPNELRGGLPKYACPDLTNKPGYWAKALPERYSETDVLLCYYVSQAGDVHYAINGDDKGVFFSGVDTRGQMWAMLDIYGNSTCIEFIDFRPTILRTVLNNSRSSLDFAALHSQDMERWIQPTLASLQISQANITTSPRPVDLPPVRYNLGVRFEEIGFHLVCGENVCLSCDKNIAWRKEDEFSQGYVFTRRPLRPGERVVIQVLNTESSYVGALAFGLTSCNLEALDVSELPHDSDMLLDRPEYWVVSKDVASSPQVGDELSFSLTLDGEVQFSKNGSTPTTFVHVDQTLQLWPFFDVYGNTQKIRLLGITFDAVRLENVIAQPQHVYLPDVTARRPVAQHSASQQQPEQQQHTVSPSLSQSSLHSQTLVVCLPEPVYQTSLTYTPPPPYIQPMDLRMSTTPPKQSPEHNIQNRPLPPTPAMPAPTSDRPIPTVHAECTICFERQIDCVLYSCGHMCLCYSCALQQWKGRGGGVCPICRAIIRDVIRTYRS